MVGLFEMRTQCNPLHPWLVDGGGAREIAEDGNGRDLLPKKRLPPRTTGLAIPLDQLIGVGARGVGLLVPIGRQPTKPGDDLREDAEDMIDVFLRVVAAEAEPHGAVNGRERDVHRPEHVRRFQRAGGAGRSARRANPLIAQLIKHPFAFHVMAGDVERVGEPGSQFAVDLDAGNLLLQ